MVMLPNFYFSFFFFLCYDWRGVLGHLGETRLLGAGYYNEFLSVLSHAYS